MELPTVQKFWRRNTRRIETKNTLNFVPDKIEFRMIHNEPNNCNHKHSQLHLYLFKYGTMNKVGIAANC